MAHTDADTHKTMFHSDVGNGLSTHGLAPLRVAQVVGKVVMGGVDQVVMNYYRHIDRSKIQFDFYMDGLGETPLDDEIRALGGGVFKLPPYEHNLRGNLSEFRRHLSAHDYQIVHSHMNTLSGFWLREAKRAGVQVRIAHSHSTAAAGEGKRALLKYALRPFTMLYANHYLACSQHAARWQFGRRHFEADRVGLVKNAISVQDFARDDSVRRSVRAELGIEGRWVVGHVGRFDYQKNHSYLVDVFEEVRTVLPDAVLLLVGDGPLRRQIEASCRAKEMADRVIFTGVRSDVPRLLQAMDCFVFPSHFEGLGMAVIEAQAAGLPCLVSTAVPTEAAVTDECDFLSLDVPASQWAAAVARVRARNIAPGKGQAVCAAGYSITDAAPELAALYARLVRETENITTGARRVARVSAGNHLRNSTEPVAECES